MDLETPEEACMREVKEETGYDIKIIKLIMKNSKHFSFLAEVIGGNLTLHENETELVENGWISMSDTEKWDSVTREILHAYLKMEQNN